MVKQMFLLIVVGVASRLFAALPSTPIPELKRAPVNPAFLAFMSNRTSAASGKFRGGYRPAPLDLSHLAAAYRRTSSSPSGGPVRLKAAAALPASWDSRSEGWVTSIKNQGYYGTCWAHATMACLETQLLKSGEGTFDLSENHLATHRDSGFLWGFDDGGNDNMAAAMLTAWCDPLLESQDPYANPSSMVSLPPVRHVQDIVWLPKRTDSLDNDTIKRAIMEYGAVSVSYYHADSFLNVSKQAYYYNGSKESNHAVTAIGWDDDFPASSFNTQPPGNGAFLIKNSWGTKGSLPDGCMWISYYDTVFCTDSSAAYPPLESTNNYGRVYSYDENGCVMSYGYEGETTAWCANVFSSVATSVVSAVGFYAMVPQTEYEVHVYTNVSASSPTSGVRILQQTGMLATAGYHTIVLDAEVPLVVQGERFSVVVKLTTPDYQRPIPCDMSFGSYCVSSANAGESYISWNGENWQDASDEGVNVCVKAYTRYGADGPAGYVLKASVDWSVGAGTVSPVQAVVAPGGEATFTASTDHPFLRFETNGVFATSEPVFTWRNVQADGEIVAFFGATNFCVDAATGDDEADGWTWATAKRTISAATDLAGPGDEVFVGPGVYGGFTSYALDSVITAVEGPERTVIDGDGGYCVYDYWDERKSIPSVYRGFTIRNGYDEYLGGGVYCGTYVGCVISNCFAASGGGAFYATLINCLLVGNGADYGGGACECALEGCTLAGNGATDAGGGVYLSDWGYAVNTLAVDNFCLAGPSAGEDICCADSKWMLNCLTNVNARFVDATNGDWHLTPQSPAVDAGSNEWVRTSFDLDGTNRIVGARVDIGCYEYSHVPSGWPVPEIEPGASAEEESAAVSNAMASAGFPAETAAAVTTAADYAKITSWAEANDVSASEQAASSTAILSPALDADGLLKITSNDLSVTSFELTTTGSETPVIRMSLTLDAYDAIKADERLLKAAVGVVGSDDLQKPFTADELSVDVRKGATDVEISVTPPAEASSYFLRTKVR